MVGGRTRTVRHKRFGNGSAKYQRSSSAKSVIGMDFVVKYKIIIISII